MSPRIRTFRADDAPALCDIYHRSVEGIGTRHYTQEQVRAWLSLTPSPARLMALTRDGRTALVAVDEEDQPLAFIDLEPDGHINFFYCLPQAAGTGVAKALYVELERRARTAGLRRLYTEASEPARAFFTRCGYLTTQRRELVVNGVQIHNYAMEKHLADCGVAAIRKVTTMDNGKKAKLVGINHVALEVGDIEEALAFWNRYFDFELRGRGEGMAFLDMGDQFLALTEGRKGGPDIHRHFGLVVDDREGLKQRLIDGGVEVLETGGLDFRDPWGNYIQVVQYCDIQYAKPPRVLEVMGLGTLEKTGDAQEQLRRKGFADPPLEG